MNMQEMGEGQPRKKGGLLYDFEQVKYERDQLTAILREALKAIDDDPERYEVYGWCNECTQGSTPHRFDKGLCWVHKARKLIGEAQ